METKIDRFPQLKSKVFTFDDMKAAFEAGYARASWEEGYSKSEEPKFETFIRMYAENQ